jgi:YHS domain-containing protein
MRKWIAGGIVLSAIVAVSLVAVPALVVSAEDADVGKCPISGKAAKKDFALNVNGKNIYFCCDKCPAGFAKKFAISEGTAKECPISGKPIDKEISLVHMTAKKVAFCCNDCPKKYAEKNNIKLVDKGAEGKTCPISGKPAKADQKLVVNGESIYFCCPNCPKSYLQKTFAIAKIDVTEKCPMSDKDTKEGTEMLVLAGKTVNFCCPNCPKSYVEKKIAAASK